MPDSDHSDFMLAISRLKQLGYQTRLIGLAVHTTITQTFYNPFDECIEATYLFPIEGEQAVVACQIRVADRVVRAKLKERGEARSDYQRAMRQGYRAALLEQNRGETFSMKVGNIPPGEAIQVQIETVGQLNVIQGEWSLRLPLVIAPRYTSGFPVPGSSVGPGVVSDTDQVPDASTVTPPTCLPGFPNPVDLTLEVHVEPGSMVHRPDWPHQLRSSLHTLVVETEGANPLTPKSCRLRIEPGERVDRDFILRGSVDTSQWVTSLVRQPSASGGETFAIHILPPAKSTDLPRDIVFLLDRSGSMSGWKMDAARRGISRLIDSLSPEDRFRLIAFDSRNESPMKEGFHRATDANRYKAVRWLANIEARGGTEMGRAIQQGIRTFSQDNMKREDSERLEPDESKEGPRSLAMVLVTDGQITGEDSVLRLLGTVPEHQRPRLFCLGVDRSVNGSVLQRISRFTGGTYELVESEKRLDEIMARFGSEMGAPSITNLEIEAIGDDCLIDQIAPSLPLDLYSGRAISIYGRLSSAAPLCHAPLRLRMRGTLPNGDPWNQDLDSPFEPSAPVVHHGDSLLHSLWGRCRVRELEDKFSSMDASDGRLQSEIIQCSIETQVLSRFTAFVAVDETQRVNLGGRVHRMTQPVESPEGWQTPVMPVIPHHQLVAIPGRDLPDVSSPSPSSASPSQRFELPKRFTDLIIQKGIVSPEQYSDAKTFSESTGTHVGDALVRLQYATSEEVAQLTAESYQMPYVDLRSVEIPLSVIELIPESVARENLVLPLSESGGTLTILMSNPSDLETVEKLQFILNRRIQAMIASPDGILRGLNHHYGQVEGESADSMLQEFTDTAIDFTETVEEHFEDYHEHECMAGDAGGDFDGYECMAFSPPALSPPPASPTPLRSLSPKKMRSMMFSSIENEGPKKPGSPAPADDTRIIRLVNLLILESVAMRASHIILHPPSDAIQVSFVIDGESVLREHIPSRILSAIVTRLKVLAKLNLAVEDRLQSGEIQLTVGDKSIDLLVHFAPSSMGTTVMLEVSEADRTKASSSESRESDAIPPCVQSWWNSAKNG